MGSTTVKGGGTNRRATSAMPSFLSQMPISNPIGNGANSTGTSSRRSEFGVIDQSRGFHVGDAANDSRNLVFTPTENSPTVNLDLRSSPFNKSLPFQVQKDLQSNSDAPTIVYNENWRESDMADSSSHTETSTDVDPDDKIRKLGMAQSAGVAISDSSDKSKRKSPDQKTMRRLAQNREAARKSRLRKKAYVQQLENSRLKLAQLEQELQQARQQGVFVSSTGDQSKTGSSNGALAFDMEYARWVDEQNKRANELRAAINSHVSDPELSSIVESMTIHFNDIFRLKGNAGKVDVFHILSGMWKTPAERCFMWIGGFRPSELLKLVTSQLEPLTEQQLAGISNLLQSSQQAEDALSQGMEALQQSLAETLATGSAGTPGSAGNVANYMGQMAMAMGKLGTLEGFLRQADNLRQQTLQQMQRTLTTRQLARAFLLIHDYFSRLRALSSLWLARPQE